MWDDPRVNGKIRSAAAPRLGTFQGNLRDRVVQQ